MANSLNKVFYRDRILPCAEANLSVMSSAVLYGLSVYTVFPVTKDGAGRLLSFRLKDHFQRLLNSAKIIGISTFESEWNYEKFVLAVDQLLSANQISSDLFLRATVHVDAEIAGTRSRGLSTVLSLFAYEATPILSNNGARLKTSVWRRIPDYAIPSRAKVNGAYVNSVLAKQDALDSGYDDCIFLDTQGHVCELSAANIFLVRGKQLITPDATSDLLEGINRRTILEIAREDLKLDVVERSVDLTELYIADEVFATGTSANIAPIIEIDARKVGNGKPGDWSQMFKKIHQELRQGTYGNCRDWIREHVLR